jgi:hypothetical protein
VKFLGDMMKVPEMKVVADSPQGGVNANV